MEGKRLPQRQALSEGQPSQCPALWPWAHKLWAPPSPPGQSGILQGDRRHSARLLAQGRGEAGLQKPLPRLQHLPSSTFLPPLITGVGEASRRHLPHSGPTEFLILTGVVVSISERTTPCLLLRWSHRSLTSIFRNKQI